MREGGGGGESHLVGEWARLPARDNLCKDGKKQGKEH